MKQNQKLKIKISKLNYLMDRCSAKNKRYLMPNQI